MIQILKTQGWLVVAAALTIGFSACSSDDIAIDGPQLADGAKSLTVTVGAGFADDASTRSAVVYDKTAKTRTLTFTSGDRLFVFGTVGEQQMDDDNYYYYNYMFYGMLNMVEGSLSKDSKSAKFAGDLTLLTPQKVKQTIEIEGEVYTFYSYEYEKNANAINDFEGKDLLSMSNDVEAHLVHQDAVEDKDFFVEIMEPISSLWDISVSFQSDLAADVSTLMTTTLDVGNYEDAYDAENKNFKLVTSSGPILNCTISGLAPNTSYNLYYYSNPEWPGNPFLTPVKADSSGKATFAFFGNKYETIHALKFEPLNANGDVDTNGYIMLVDLGEKELSSTTVYNITATATTEGQGFETPGDGGNW